MMSNKLTKFNRFHKVLKRGFLPMSPQEYLINSHESLFKKGIKEITLKPLPRCSKFKRPRNGSWR